MNTQAPVRSKKEIVKQAFMHESIVRSALPLIRSAGYDARMSSYDYSITVNVTDTKGNTVSVQNIREEWLTFGKEKLADYVIDQIKYLEDKSNVREVVDIHKSYVANLIEEKCDFVSHHTEWVDYLVSKCSMFAKLGVLQKVLDSIEILRTEGLYYSVSNRNSSGFLALDTLERMNLLSLGSILGMNEGRVPNKEATDRRLDKLAQNDERYQILSNELQLTRDDTVMLLFTAMSYYNAVKDLYPKSKQEEESERRSELRAEEKRLREDGIRRDAELKAAKLKETRDKAMKIVSERDDINAKIMVVKSKDDSEALISDGILCFDRTINLLSLSVVDDRTFNEGKRKIRPNVFFGGVFVSLTKDGKTEEFISGSKGGRKHFTKSDEVPENTIVLNGESKFILSNPRNTEGILSGTRYTAKGTASELLVGFEESIELDLVIESKIDLLTTGITTEQRAVGPFEEQHGFEVKILGYLLLASWVNPNRKEEIEALAQELLKQESCREEVAIVAEKAIGDNLCDRIIEEEEVKEVDLAGLANHFNGNR